MPSFIEKGGGPEALKGGLYDPWSFWLIVAAAMLWMLMSQGCGCDAYVDGICVNGSVDGEDVRSAISAVRDECSLSVGMDLTISFLEYAPERSQGGTPIPAHFLSSENRVEVWRESTRPLDSLRHELIHAALYHLGEDTDRDHRNPELWCGANMKDSCEARVRESCYSE